MIILLVILDLYPILDSVKNRYAQYTMPLPLLHPQYKFTFLRLLGNYVVIMM